MSIIPDRITPKTGWQPTVSTTAGLGLGLPLAHLLCGAIPYIFHTAPISSAYVADVTAVVCFLCGYVFPDGGRK